MAAQGRPGKESNRRRRRRRRRRRHDDDRRHSLPGHGFFTIVITTSPSSSRRRRLRTATPPSSPVPPPPAGHPPPSSSSNLHLHISGHLPCNVHPQRYPSPSPLPYHPPSSPSSSLLHAPHRLPLRPDPSSSPIFHLPRFPVKTSSPHFRSFLPPPSTTSHGIFPPPANTPLSTLTIVLTPLHDLRSSPSSTRITNFRLPLLYLLISVSIFPSSIPRTLPVRHLFPRSISSLCNSPRTAQFSLLKSLSSRASTPARIVKFDPPPQPEFRLTISHPVAR